LVKGFDEQNKNTTEVRGLNRRDVDAIRNQTPRGNAVVDAIATRRSPVTTPSGAVRRRRHRHDGDAPAIADASPPKCAVGEKIGYIKLKTMSSLGETAFCEKLIATELGSESHPVQTIHRASTDRYQNDLNWVEAASGETRLRLQTNGHLAIAQDIHFYSTTNVATGALKYSLGLSSDGTKFQIVNETTGAVVLEASDASASSVAISSVTGLVAVLDGKQASLTCIYN
jgi:hypothetical protein